MRTLRRVVSCVRLLAAVCVAHSASAGISNAFVADVTPASLAIIAIGDSPVLNATTRVFLDAAGVQEITSQVVPVLTSSDHPGMHTRGIVRVDLDDLAPQTQYYVRLEVQQASGTFTYPSDGSLLSVRTALNASLVSSTTSLLDLNETLRHRVYLPAVLTSDDDVLVTATTSLPASTPLAEFSSSRTATPIAYFELSNLQATNGNRISLAPGTVLTLHEYDGLPCSADGLGELVRFRKAPERTAAGTALELRDAQRCFASDTNCDGTVDVLDVQFLLNTWSRHTGDCGFNPDLDLAADGTVDVLDLQSLLNHFGQPIPEL